MTSAFSSQNSISLCPASFRIPRPNLPVTPGVSLLPTFVFQSLIKKRTSVLGVSSRMLVSPPFLTPGQRPNAYLVGFLSLSFFLILGRLSAEG